MTEATRQEMFRVYARTGSLKQAAAVAHVSIATAHGWLRRAGAIKRPKTNHTARMSTEAVRLYVELELGCPQVAQLLAQKYNPAPSVQWVRDQVLRAGVGRSISKAMRIAQKRRFGVDFDAVRAEARRLYFGRKLSVKRISLMLGVDANTITLAIPESRRADMSESAYRRWWQADLPDVNLRRARFDEAIDRRRRGEKIPTIAAALGVSVPTVQRWLRMALMTNPKGKRA